MAHSMDEILAARIARGAQAQAAVRIGIVGTAGRRDDGPKLSRASFARMCDAARAVIRVKACTGMVSGGAAWADHVAVALALDGTLPAPSLVLHLPAPYAGGRFDEAGRDGGVANHYHRLFRERTGVDGLADIGRAIAAGATVEVNPAGFKARNSDVARDSDVLLAFTFGAGDPWKAKVHGDVTAREAGLKDGGTADTFDKCRARTKVHVCLGPMA